jgi:hypothetical protein
MQYLGGLAVAQLLRCCYFDIGREQNPIAVIVHYGTEAEQMSPNNHDCNKINDYQSPSANEE